jgi:CheY-like chemotaxis protein
MLEAAGHRVDIVSDGAEAIMAVQETAYDLVMMDVQMPGMDGVTATRRIRELPAPAGTVPIIAATANVLRQQVTSFKQAGMNDHVGKPLDRKELYAVVEHWGKPSAALREGRRGRGYRKRSDEACPPNPGPSRAAGDGGTTESETHLAMVRERFRTRLAGRLEALQAASRQRCASPQDPSVLGTIKRLAHDLAGSSGTLGFPELGEIASTLETAVLRALVSPEEEHGMARALHALTTAIEDTIAEGRPA